MAIHLQASDDDYNLYWPFTLVIRKEELICKMLTPRTIPLYFVSESELSTVGALHCVKHLGQRTQTWTGWKPVQSSKQTEDMCKGEISSLCPSLENKQFHLRWMYHKRLWSLKCSCQNDHSYSSHGILAPQLFSHVAFDTLKVKQRQEASQ